MYEEVVINAGFLLSVMALNLVLAIKVRIPLLNIVSGVLLVLMAWTIGTLPASPYIQLMATFFGIFTTAESVKGVI